MIVYITTNLVNGKRYIGRVSDPNRKYLGSGVYLKEAIKKYGKENFRRETLEVCSNKKELLEREVYWIKKFNAVKNKDFYNAIDTQTPDRAGISPNREVREKTSKTLKGRVSPFIGHKHTAEAKEKIGASSRGKTRVFTQEWKDKLKKARSCYIKKKCIYCNKEYIPQMYKRWHGVNCKNYK